MPRVLNKHRDEIPADAVYIGRPSIWGNPFKVGRDGGRGDCVLLHREWIVAQPGLMARIGRLRGKDLVCFCAPAACHGDILLELANRDLPVKLP